MRATDVMPSSQPRLPEMSESEYLNVEDDVRALKHPPGRSPEAKRSRAKRSSRDFSRCGSGTGADQARRPHWRPRCSWGPKNLYR